MSGGQQIAASVDKNGTLKPKHFNLAVKSIFQSICVIFPQQAMFNLMRRWSCQLKFHFKPNTINVLAVLCHQLNMDLLTFLLTARCWQIFSMSTKGGKAKRQCATITYVQNHEKANNIVNHLHTSIELLNYDIISEKYLYISYHRMDEWNQKIQYLTVNNKQ